MALVIEASDTTVDSDTPNTTPQSVDLPAYGNGDLVIVCISAVKGQSGNFTVTPPSGPNSETFTSQVNVVEAGTNSGRPLIWVGWFIGSGSDAGTTVSFAFTDDVIGHTTGMVVVPSGEFDSTTPISTAAAQYSSGSTSSIAIPGFTANSDDAGGKVLAMVGADNDAIDTTMPTGWTQFQNVDPGRSPGCLAGRDAEVTASESIAAATWTIAGDAAAGYAFIVREGAGGSIAPQARHHLQNQMSN